MPAERKKRCLYEVLAVSRDCSSDEIRSAYRKLALQLHPDKVAAASGGVVSEAATAAFQELLHAYEVLSDPRERAYYDSHRSQILFSETDVGAGRNNSCFDLDLFSFMSPSAFSGYSDTGRGFYKVYREAFEKIYSQELRFAKAMELGSDTVHPAPLMGNLESPYTQVSAFYNYWLSFCTVLDFAWVDMYDAAAGYDRRDRRKMEEENKKLRRKAKREYNETVRGLAAFVKKRDKRVMDMAVKKKAEEEKKRAEEREKKKEEERKKLERAMQYEEPDWAKADNVDEEDTMKDDDDFGLEGEDNKRKELYCVVCSKKFKSEKQWKNHEQSKKHKDKVAEFRNSLVDEEEEDQEDQELSEGNAHDMEDSHASVGSALGAKSDDELCFQFECLLDAEEEIDAAAASDAESNDDGEAKILEAMISGRKGKKGSFQQSDPAPAPAPVPVSNLNGDVDSEEEGHTEYNVYKKGGKSRARRKGGKGKMDEDRQKEVPIDVVNGESAPQTNNESFPETESSHAVKADRRKNEHNHVAGKNQKTKQQKFDGRILATEGLETSKKPSKGKKQKGGSKAPSNGCDTCGESFDSRNKLFMHLGETGHSILKSR